MQQLDFTWTRQPDEIVGKKSATVYQLRFPRVEASLVYYIQGSVATLRSIEAGTLTPDPNTGQKGTGIGAFMVWKMANHVRGLDVTTIRVGAPTPEANTVYEKMGFNGTPVVADDKPIDTEWGRVMDWQGDSETVSGKAMGRVPNFEENWDPGHRRTPRSPGPDQRRNRDTDVGTQTDVGTETDVGTKTDVGNQTDFVDPAQTDQTDVGTETDVGTQTDFVDLSRPTRLTSGPRPTSWTWSRPTSGQSLDVGLIPTSDPDARRTQTDVGTQTDFVDLVETDVGTQTDVEDPAGAGSFGIGEPGEL